MLRSGVVRGKRGARGPRRYLPGGWSETVLPVQAFLVEHPAGACLFDAGASASTAPLPGMHPYLRLARFELSPEDEIGRQLDAVTVRWLVLSHLHTDHVGSVAAFGTSDVIVSRAEWEHARGWRGRARGYVPHHWPNAVTPRLVGPDGPPLGPFRGRLDLAGDGRLVVVPLPGHTAGHLGLLVDTGTARLLLAGDAAHSAAELATAQPDVARWCASEGVVVLTAHDPAAPELLALTGQAAREAEGVS